MDVRGCNGRDGDCDCGDGGDGVVRIVRPLPALAYRRPLQSGERRRLSLPWEAHGPIVLRSAALQPPAQVALVVVMVVRVGVVVWCSLSLLAADQLW